MAHSVTLRVFPNDLAPKTQYISLNATRNTHTRELIETTLERLQLSDDWSKYELCIGDTNTPSTHWEPLEETDHPVIHLETREKKNTHSHISQTKLFLRSRADACLLSELVGGQTREATPDSSLEDLCKLHDLSEQSMLNILKARFENDLIYTYAGTILIAINPYYFYSIYNLKSSDLYQGRHLGDLPPHIFAIADAAYNSMLNDRCNQAVIISGESGAGKTESTKFLLHQLMTFSSKFEETDTLELITLGTGPVLEAFGNAKTVANNNSSRFGKYIQVKFKENGAYFSASIEKYLLEKSRIVSQSSRERNYHVFYYLLYGADRELKSRLHLMAPNQYHYLGQRTVVPLEGVDEVKEFQRLCESLSMLSFSHQIQTRMFTVLSAILHIGNIEFMKNESGEGIHIVNQETLHIVSSLLRVEQQTLSSALTTRTSRVGGMDSFVTHYSLEEAAATRDAMAKALYGALFDWIVDKVNEALEAKHKRGTHKGNTIGVLDIFGFEVFQRNSFEQFCINYANEQLQHYFNKHIFKLEQLEYVAEGIHWQSVSFVDNTDCLDLIAKRPTGLLSLLDEECSFPGADDFSLFQKFERQHKSHTYFSTPQLKQRNPVFTINHYASSVTYAIEGFREKNRDLMRQDIVSVLMTSKADLVRALIGLPRYAVQLWRTALLSVQASQAFRKAGIVNRVRKDDQFTASMPVVFDSSQHSDFSATFRIGSPDISKAPTIMVPGQRTTSPEPFPLEHAKHKHTILGGHKSYELSHDMTDGASHSKSRHPSIANLLRKKKLLRKMGPSGNRDGSPPPFLGGSGPRIKAESKRPSASKLQSLVSSSSSSSSSRSSTKTVSAQFHTSLVALMDQLEKTQPYFVRCIKSNNNKAARQFDMDVVSRQLRYTGMMETVRIRRSGFSVRMNFEDFYELYQFLIGQRKTDLATQICQFLNGFGFTNSEVQMGTTKVFMREHQKRILQNELRDRVLDKIVLIQRWIRAKMMRCRFLHTRRCVLLIQSFVRGWLSRRRVDMIRERVCAAVVLQSSWRSHCVRRTFITMKAAAIMVQAMWRGWKARKRYALLLAEKLLREKEVEEAILREREAIEKRRITEESKQKDLVVEREEASEVSGGQKEIELVLSSFDALVDEIESQQDTRTHTSNVTTSEAKAAETNVPSLPNRTDQSSPSLSQSSSSSGSPDLSRQPAGSTAALRRPRKSSTTGRNAVRYSQPVMELTPPGPSYQTATLKALKGTGSVQNIISQLQHYPPSSTGSPTTKRSGSPSAKLPGSPLASSRVSMFAALYDSTKKAGEKEEERTPQKSTGIPIRKIQSPFLRRDSSQDSSSSPSSSKSSQIRKHSSEESNVIACPKNTESAHGSHVMACSEDPENEHDNQVILCTENTETANDSRVITSSNSVQVPLVTVPHKKQPSVEPVEGKLVAREEESDKTREQDLEDSLTLAEALAMDADMHIPTNEQSTNDLKTTEANFIHTRITISPEEGQELPSDSDLTQPITKRRMSSKKRKRQSAKSTDHISVEGELSDDSTELTRGLSPDTLYRVNYQLRHSASSGSNDSLVMSPTPMSPMQDRDRFVVDNKPWYKKGLGLKLKLGLRRGSREKEEVTKPMLSRIRKMGSPGSLESTPISTPTSPQHAGRRSATLSTRRLRNAARESPHLFKSTMAAKFTCCDVCKKSFSGFLRHGLKCQICNVVVHKYCQERAPVCLGHTVEPGTNVSMEMGTVVHCSEELDQLTRFLIEKHHLHQNALVGASSSVKTIDKVFQMSLTEFHASLLSSYSLFIQDINTKPTNSSSPSSSPLCLTCEQLVNSFTNIYRSMAKREGLVVSDSDVSIGINQIRAFLDEFSKMKSDQSKQQQQQTRTRTLSDGSSKLRLLRRKARREKEPDTRVHKGHHFVLQQLNVKMVCDHCNKVIGVLEKGEVCRDCNHTAHDSCVKKVTQHCEGKVSDREGDKESAPKSQFGVPLSKLVPAGSVMVPTVLEKCFVCLEEHGLYTAGIYRRSAGPSSKRAVREAVDTDPDGADLEQFSLHAVAATVGAFFRELPEPLLTLNLYKDFIRTTDISDETDMLETLFHLVNKLPELNHCVFERLVFHLARVAQQESVNKMDAHNLSIIFAPNLLRDPKGDNPDHLLKMMPKQAKVLEVIISDQVRKLTATIKSIRKLSSAAANTAFRLSLLRSKEHTVTEEKDHSSPRKVSAQNHSNAGRSVLSSEESDKKENNLRHELAEIEKERAHLTATLPILEPFTPTENRRVSFPCHPPSSSSSSSSSPSSSGVVTTGSTRDEFAQRRSLFQAAGQQKESGAVASKRTSFGGTTTMSGSPSSELLADEKEEDVDLFSDIILSTEVLKPLTKNRAARGASRRQPSPRHKRPHQPVGGADSTSLR